MQICATEKEHFDDAFVVMHIPDNLVDDLHIGLSFSLLSLFRCLQLTLFYFMNISHIDLTRAVQGMLMPIVNYHALRELDRPWNRAETESLRWVIVAQ